MLPTTGESGAPQSAMESWTVVPLLGTNIAWSDVARQLVGERAVLHRAAHGLAREVSAHARCFLDVRRRSRSWQRRDRRVRSWQGSGIGPIARLCRADFFVLGLRLMGGWTTRTWLWRQDHQRAALTLRRRARGLSSSSSSQPTDERLMWRMLTELGGK